MKRLRRAIHIFNFSVADDVNEHRLDQLAEAHRGASEYVRPDGHIEAKVSQFHDQINLPLLTNLRLRIEDVGAYDLHSVELPDLFAGDPLIVVGRYRGSGQATVCLQRDAIVPKQGDFTFEALWGLNK